MTVDIPIGAEFGFWSVVGDAGFDPRRQRQWVCRCVCGAERTVKGHTLRKGKTRSCGCQTGSLISAAQEGQIRRPRGPKHDLTGHTFGRLSALAVEGKDKLGNYTWMCRCEKCDILCIVPAPLLLNGSVKSCGCLRADKARETSANKPRLPVEVRDAKAIMSSYRRNARTKKIPFELGKDEWSVLIEAPCYYCGTAPEQRIRQDGMRYNGVDRKNRTMGYVAGNVVTACGRCNIAKGKMDHDVFLSWVRRVAEHHR